MENDSVYRIAFFGQAGRGKSSLINALFGTNFEINSVEECTKYVHSATLINNNDTVCYKLYSIYDTPGVGASIANDAYYSTFYKYVLGIADCIVYVTNMQRTDRRDQEFLVKYKEYIKDDVKFIFCVNQIDYFSPSDHEGLIWDDDNNCPSSILNFYLYDKGSGRVQYVREKFGKYIPVSYRIVCTSALHSFGISELRQIILNDEG